MPDNKNDDKQLPDDGSDDQAAQPGEVRLTPAGKKPARYEELPPAPPDKQIHPRRPLPPVPDKADETPPEQDETPPHPKK